MAHLNLIKFLGVFDLRCRKIRINKLTVSRFVSSDVSFSKAKVTVRLKDAF